MTNIEFWTALSAIGALAYCSITAATLITTKRISASVVRILARKSSGLRSTDTPGSKSMCTRAVFFFGKFHSCPMTRDDTTGIADSPTFARHIPSD
jgi:hypothetical protein